MSETFPRYWFSIYNFATQTWSFPRYLTEFEAVREGMGVQFHYPLAPPPVVARWRPDPETSSGRWEYRPGIGQDYVALR